MELKIEYIPIGELRTYANNAKIHTAEQIEQIKQSIEQFGMNDPIAIWRNNEIIEGHGRLIACMELGFDKVPVIRLDDLSDDERRAYMLVHNKLTMNTDFDFDILQDELMNFTTINMEDFGFDSLVSTEDTESKDVRNHEELHSVYQIIIDCDSENEMERYYDEITEMGIECRTSTL